MIPVIASALRLVERFYLNELKAVELESHLLEAGWYNVRFSPEVRATYLNIEYELE